MDESIKKIGNLCVELEIELAKITRDFEIEKVDDNYLQVVRVDTGEDCAIDLAMATTYISKIDDIVNKYQKTVVGKLEKVDPDWKKKVEEYREKNNRK